MSVLLGAREVHLCAWKDSRYPELINDVWLGLVHIKNNSSRCERVYSTELKLVNIWV